MVRPEERIVSVPARTLIGVLASRDSPERNRALAGVLKEAATKAEMKDFAFVFTGGTYKRMFAGWEDESGKKQKALLPPKIQKLLKERCGVIVLPDVRDGGITILANLIVQRLVSIVWPFYTSWTTHILNPENLALLRLCDQWHVKKLMNIRSVSEWMLGEAHLDANRNVRPLDIPMTTLGDIKKASPKKGVWYFDSPSRKDGADFLFDPEWDRIADRIQSRRCLRAMRIALISHDDKKDRMREFVIDYQEELRCFKAIVTTGTTGRIVLDAAPSLESVVDEQAGARILVRRKNSGPKGGDIEIASEILYGNVHAVVFFVDPLHPHPHTDDIQVVFRACMMNDNVRMLSNEQQAREWMDRAVRRIGIRAPES